MTIENRRQQILEFVKLNHGEQKRKYTGEPYWHHLVSVAERVVKYEKWAFAYEVALLHDIFEDTKCDVAVLEEFLLNIGYHSNEVFEITNGVQCLTDEFTKEKYPEYNRKKRKDMESLRLSMIPKHIQSIKYADLIDNCISISEHDPNFSVIYLSEKKEILKHMKFGNFDLFLDCCYHLVSNQKPILMNDKV